MLLRNFTVADFEYIKQNWTGTERIIGTTFPDTFQDYQTLIRKWGAREYNGKYFEQFIIIDNLIPVGLCSLMEQTNGSVSIGVIIDKNFWRKGYCTRACSELVKIAKEKGYKKAVAGVGEFNTPSIEFCKKFGFIYKDTIVNSHNRKQLNFEFII